MNQLLFPTLMEALMGSRMVSLVVILLFTSTQAPAQTDKRHVDRVFLNGKIWTGDDARPQAEALAVSGYKIVAVGSTAEVKALADSDTAIVDLRGKLVVPGF